MSSVAENLQGAINPDFSVPVASYSLRPEHPCLRRG